MAEKAEKEKAEKKPKAPRAKKKVAEGAAGAPSGPRAAAKYEAMFLFPPPGTVDVEGMLANARSIIERHGGKVLFIKKWDERKLAYEIRRQKRGTFIIAFYEGPGPSVVAIERDVNLSEDVIRVLITRADHLSQKEMEAVEPQPIQPREERAPWDRPYGFDEPRRPFRRDEGRPEAAPAGKD
jgi:small subunit ribosomal protein S6